MTYIIPIEIELPRHKGGRSEYAPTTKWERINLAEYHIWAALRIGNSSPKRAAEREAHNARARYWLTTE